MSMGLKGSFWEDWKFLSDFDTKFKSPISVWKTVQSAELELALHTLPPTTFVSDTLHQNLHQMGQFSR